jgi:hypothetical protein
MIEGSGSRRPKKIRIRRIRIRNTVSQAKGNQIKWLTAPILYHPWSNAAEIKERLQVGKAGGILPRETRDWWPLTTVEN